MSFSSYALTGFTHYFCSGRLSFFSSYPAEKHEGNQKCTLSNASGNGPNRPKLVSRLCSPDRMLRSAKGTPAARSFSAAFYLGYKRTTGSASPEGIRRDEAERYTAGNPASNQLSLEGDWTIGPERVILNTLEGDITYRFRTRDLHLVLGHADGSKPVRFTISIDGAPPGASHGIDTDQSGEVVVAETRLYQLVRQSGDIREHTFKVHFFDTSIAAYSFTFG